MIHNQNINTHISFTKVPRTLRRRNCKNQRSFSTHVWGKLGLGNRTTILISSFSKSSVCKMISVHTKTQRRRFHIPPVWRAFSWRITCSVDGRPNRRNVYKFLRGSVSRALVSIPVTFSSFLCPVLSSIREGRTGKSMRLRANKMQLLWRAIHNLTST